MPYTHNFRKSIVKTIFERGKNSTKTHTHYFVHSHKNALFAQNKIVIRMHKIVLFYFVQIHYFVHSYHYFVHSYDYSVMDVRHGCKAIFRDV